MENLFSYIAGAFAIILVVLGALLLFPFFPMMALCFVLACLFATSIITTFSSEENEENRAERAKA